MDKVLDFTCGSGSLLQNVRTRIKENGGSIGKIFGEKKKITTYNLARMNMLLLGMRDTELEIFHGDTLLNQRDLLNEMNPSKKIEFDAIVANPPFSLRWDPNDTLAKDFRFKSYGLAPKSAADFAFLLHGFRFLGKEGTMAIILPHGVLFRGGAEERIRNAKYVINQHIKSVKTALFHRLKHRQILQPILKLFKSYCFWASYSNRLSRKYIHKVIRKLNFAMGAGKEKVFSLV